MTNYLEFKNAASFYGESNFIQSVKKLVVQLSQNTACVLLQGEKGTGKSLFARAVHFEGQNKAANYLEVNCSSVKPEAIEQLFVKLSDLSSSDSVRKTIYFSNIEGLSLVLQQKLTGLIKLIRENKKNIRFIFSTKENLDKKIEENAFLPDLYFQISTVPVNMLPLRQRKEDILQIAQGFLKENERKSGNGFSDFSEAAKKALTEHYWKANVAELKNAVERACLLDEPPFITVKGMAIKPAENTETELQTEEFENCEQTLKEATDAFKKRYVTQVLQANNWNQTKTARVLGIQRTYVIRLINELQIRK